MHFEFFLAFFNSPKSLARYAQTNTAERTVEKLTRELWIIICYYLTQSCSLPCVYYTTRVV